MSAVPNNLITWNRSPIVRSVGALLLLGSLSACSDGGSSPSFINDDGFSRHGELRVSPNQFKLREGDSVAVTTKLVGGSTFDPRKVRWSVSPARGGVVRNGYFVADWYGNVTITATYPGTTGTASAEVLPAPRAIDQIGAAFLAGTAGLPLPDSVRFRVSGRDGVAVPDVAVAFEVESGGGSVANVRVQTDRLGVARTTWTLGPATGRNKLKAGVKEDIGATLEAEAYADLKTARVELLEGMGQSARVGDLLPQPLVVNVTEPNGTPIRGVTLEWTFDGDGSESGLFDGPATTGSTTRVVTDGQGVSRVYWRLGTRAGPQEGSAVIIAAGGSAVSGNGNKGRIDFSAEATPGPLAEIDITTDQASLEVTEEIGLEAAATDRFGNPVEAELDWSASDSSVAAVDNGLVRALRPGNAVVTARSGAVADNTVIRVLSGAPATMTAGGQGQSAAVGQALAEPVNVQVSDANGSPVSGVEVAWSVATGEGTLSAASVTTDPNGFASVRWTLGQTAGMQTVRASTSDLQPIVIAATASAGPVASLTVTPSTASLQIGETRPLAVDARDAFGNALATPVVWSSTDPSVAAVDATGRVGALAAGEAQVLARAGNVSGLAVITVAGEGSGDGGEGGGGGDGGGGTSIPSTITPQGNSQIGQVGQSLASPISVRVVDAEGRALQGLTVTWDVLSGGGSLSSGSVQTDAQGEAAVAWTLGGAAGAQTARALVSGLSTTFTAIGNHGPVAQVAVTPPQSSIGIGESEQYSAQPADAYGNPVSTPVSWSTLDPAAVSIDGSGLATGIAEGSVEIRAAADGVSGSASLTVVNPSGGEPGRPGRVLDLQGVSSNESSVTLRFTEVDDGTGAPAKYALRYDSPTIASRWGSAYPTEVSLAGTQIGAVREYTYAGLASGSAFEFRLVSYRGTLNQDATFGPMSNIASGATDAPAGQPQVASVTASTDSRTFNSLAESLQLSATARDASGNTLPGIMFNWISTNPSVAGVDLMGRVTSQAVGTAAIIVSAVCCSSTDTVQITVNQIPTAVEVTPTSFSLRVGESQQLNAIVKDSNGFPVSGVAVTWSSTAPSVVSVTSAGLATALAAGSASLQARTSMLTGVSNATVVDPAPASVQVSPSAFGLRVGQQLQLSAGVFDGSGQLADDQNVTWSSDAPSIATVSSTGLVTAVAVGTVSIEARSGTLVGSTNGIIEEVPQDAFLANEPVGFVTLTNRPFDQRDPSDWWVAGSGRAGSTGDKFEIVQDATAPYSGNNVGRMTYDPGFGGGWPPARTGFGRLSVGEVYVSMWFKVSANWQAHPVGVNKILYITDASSGGGGDPMYLNLRNAGSNQFFFEARVQGPTGARNLAENVSNVRVLPGLWYHVELVLKMNSSPTASNGEAHMWVNGTKTTQYTNIRWSLGDLSFDSVRWEPIWGGTGGTVIDTMYQFMDHIYVSGR